MAEASSIRSNCQCWPWQTRDYAPGVPGCRVPRGSESMHRRVTKCRSYSTGGLRILARNSIPGWYSGHAAGHCQVHTFWSPVPLLALSGFDQDLVGPCGRALVPEHPVPSSRGRAPAKQKSGTLYLCQGTHPPLLPWMSSISGAQTSHQGERAPRPCRVAPRSWLTHASTRDHPLGGSGSRQTISWLELRTK